jgi:hypothetical protein
LTSELVGGEPLHCVTIQKTKTSVARHQKDEGGRKLLLDVCFETGEILLTMPFIGV